MTDAPRRLGRYEIIERAGRGGMGVLYRGRDTVLDREVAIKVLAGDFLEDETATQRFYREARAVARLQHRNIVTIFELGEENSTPYIVMEFLRGHDLGQRMRAEPPPTLDEKLDIVSQLCVGLHFAHQQEIVHRDIKPGNIRILQDGTVKILDFGIAKVSGSTLTSSVGLVGTAAYMSPEQVRGERVDNRSDIFSAGVVLYELVSGHKPFEADTATAVLMKIVDEEPVPIESLAPDLPARLLGVIRKALQKNPDDRYSTAAEMAADLQAVRLSLAPPAETYPGDIDFSDAAGKAPAGGAPEPAGEVAILERPVAMPASKWPRRRLWLPATLGAVVVMAILSRFVPGLWPRPAPKLDPPPPPPPSRITLRIESEPSGASIILSGIKSEHLTPASVTFEENAIPVVKVSKEGFVAKEITPTAAHLKTGLITFRLQPIPKPEGYVEIGDADYDFQVDDPPDSLSAPARQHRLFVRGSRRVRLYAPEVRLDKVITVEFGRRPDPMPALGRLKVTAREEGCPIFVDGHSDWDIWAPKVYSIVAGSHSLEQRCPGSAPQKRNVTITPGGEQTVSF